MSETLLTLQKPRTKLPDEKVFIMFHQITELYFRLTLIEIDKILDNEDNCTEDSFAAGISMMCSYFRHIINSFAIMKSGMERAQFLEFRKTLVPASGFQSVQYRQIELKCTEPINLVSPDKRVLITDNDAAQIVEGLYWRHLVNSNSNARVNVGLKMFEEKYMPLIREWATKSQTKNIWSVFSRKFLTSQHLFSLSEQLREFDQLVNISWPMAHLDLASHHLKDPAAVPIKSTGGTDWRKYLAPRFQRIIFFPSLWTTHEKENWGNKPIVKPS